MSEADDFAAALCERYPDGKVFAVIPSGVMLGFDGPDGLVEQFPIIVHQKLLRGARKAWPGVDFVASVRLNAGRRRSSGRGQRRRKRRWERAQQRRERLREIQLSQRRAGRVDGPRGRITGPGTYNLGGGVTVTFGEGTLVGDGP